MLWVVYFRLIQFFKTGKNGKALILVPFPQGEGPVQHHSHLSSNRHEAQNLARIVKLRHCWPGSWISGNFSDRGNSFLFPCESKSAYTPVRSDPAAPQSVAESAWVLTGDADRPPSCFLCMVLSTGQYTARAFSWLHLVGLEKDVLTQAVLSPPRPRESCRRLGRQEPRVSAHSGGGSARPLCTRVLVCFYVYNNLLWHAPKSHCIILHFILFQCKGSCGRCLSLWILRSISSLGWFIVSFFSSFVEIYNSHVS